MSHPIRKKICQIGISLSDTVIFMILLSIVSLIYIMLFLAYHILLEQTTNTKIWELSLAIAPIGAIVRFSFDKRLNPTSWLPIGTLASNLLSILIGSLVLKL
jgi:hypothetical protein